MKFFIFLIISFSLSVSHASVYVENLRKQNKCINTTKTYKQLVKCLKNIGKKR